jgi:hypothetical protein
VVCRLLDICPELEFDSFLTTLEKEVNESDQYGGYGGYDRYDHYWDDEEEDEDDHGSMDQLVEESFCAKVIFDLAGREIVSKISIKEEDILHDDAFGDEADHEECEDSMSYSGSDVTHFYRRTVRKLHESPMT